MKKTIKEPVVLLENPTKQLRKVMRENPSIRISTEIRNRFIKYDNFAKISHIY